MSMVGSHQREESSDHRKFSFILLPQFLELGITISFFSVYLCKRSWYNLRDSYRRALRKRRDALNEGLPCRKWRYEDEMEFMAMHVTLRDVNDRADADETLGDDGGIPEKKPHIGGDSQDPLFIPKVKSEKQRKTPNPSRKRPYEDNAPITDHIDGFLIGIGATLRNFSRHYQNLAKSKIFNLVSEMELQQIMEFKKQSEKGEADSQNDPGKQDRDHEEDEREYGEIAAPAIVLDDDKEDANQTGASEENNKSANHTIALDEDKDDANHTNPLDGDKDDANHTISLDDDKDDANQTISLDDSNRSESTEEAPFLHETQSNNGHEVDPLSFGFSF